MRDTERLGFAILGTGAIANRYQQAIAANADLVIRLVPGWRHRPAFVLGWSSWRRRHQAIARTCHIKRRQVSLGEKQSL